MDRKSNIKITPEQYAKIKEEQIAMAKIFGEKIQIARLCPYCGHKITVLCKGSHGYAKEKCPSCKEDVVFPPIVFRMRK